LRQRSGEIAAFTTADPAIIIHGQIVDVHRVYILSILSIGPNTFTSSSPPDARDLSEESGKPTEPLSGKLFPRTTFSECCDLPTAAAKYAAFGRDDRVERGYDRKRISCHIDRSFPFSSRPQLARTLRQRSG